MISGLSVRETGEESGERREPQVPINNRARERTRESVCESGKFVVKNSC